MKYKLNNEVRTPSQVTLTSYLTGNEISDDRTNMSDSNLNIASPAGCQCCAHFCKPDNVLSAQHNCQMNANVNSNALSELAMGNNLDKTVCLCEKYMNGCSKFCSGAHGDCGADKSDSRFDPCKEVQCRSSLTSISAGALAHHTHRAAARAPPKQGDGARGTALRARAVRRARAACSLKTLRRRLPIVAWLPRYNLRAGLADLIAGITVGLTVIPQAIAYANVAGLPPQYGLYSSFMGCFVYAILGSCKDSPVGPTAIAAILTRENLHGLGAEFAVLLCFLSGCIELLMGILQLGFLIDFISGPVSVGFTSAAALIIASSQVKDVLGLSFPGGKFLQVWAGLYEHISETRLWDTVLGLSCIVVLLLLRKVKDIKVGDEDEELVLSGKRSRWRAVTSNALWFLSTTRNILVVVICAALAYYFQAQHKRPFILTGDVKAGLPNFTPPPFQATVGNHTYTFVEMASTLGSAIFVVPLLSILENIALAKVFSEGKSVDATQEMIALGLCNMASSFVDSMPVSGALSRGAVNHASGVQTTFGGVYTGILVLLSLQFFTPYFYYIPKASLAAVIIAAVVFMMELHVFKPIWRTKKMDIIPAIVTFMSCLLVRLELGIVIGIATNLVFLLYASARPSVKVNWAVSASGVEHLVAVVDRSLSFPSAEYVRHALGKAADRGRDPPPPLVIDASHVQAADFTAAKGIKLLIDDFYTRGQPLIFYNIKPSIVEIFRGVRPREFLHCDCPATLDTMLKEATLQTRIKMNSINSLSLKVANDRP